MPNHFTLIGIGSGDYESLESKGLELEKLNGKNLCEEIAPLPQELSNIVASNRPCRYRHKQTGQWHDSVNSPIEDRENWEQVDLTDDEIDRVVKQHGASTWYDWQRINWGTKWGTYDLKVHVFGGDGLPMAIECQCAWGPPNAEMMRRINDWLLKKFAISNLRWLGHDPYNGSIVDVEVAVACAN